MYELANSFLVCFAFSARSVGQRCKEAWVDCWRKLKPWPDVWMVWMNGFGHVPVGSGSWSSFIGTTGASPKTTVSRYRNSTFFCKIWILSVYLYNHYSSIYPGSFVVLNVSNDDTEKKNLLGLRRILCHSEVQAPTLIAWCFCCAIGSGSNGYLQNSNALSKSTLKRHFQNMYSKFFLQWCRKKSSWFSRRFLFNSLVGGCRKKGAVMKEDELAKVWGPRHPNNVIESWSNRFGWTRYLGGSSCRWFILGNVYLMNIQYHALHIYRHMYLYWIYTRYIKFLY